MSKLVKTSSLAVLSIGLAVGLLVGVGMMIGTYVTMNQVNHDQNSEIQIPEHLLHASSATTGKSMAMATGPIYEEAEGIFVLDFLTGQLYCWVPNPRGLADGYQAVYKTNVIDALGVEKGKTPDYILTTGLIQTVGRGAGAAPANCVCYVADCNTGRVAMYTLAFNKAMAKANRPQAGELILMGVAPARPEVEQEQ